MPHPTIKNKPKNLKNFWWWYRGKKHPNAHLDLFYALKVVQDIIFFRYKQYPKNVNVFLFYFILFYPQDYS
jgi:hypothetical protein